MSDNTDGLDADDDATNEPKKPNGLRQALEAANAKQAQLETELTELRKERRQRTVAETLEKYGASPELAEFYNKPEASEDDVLGWLKEKGAVFGWSEGGDGEDTDDAETMEEARRISRATASAPQKPASRSLTTDTFKGEYQKLRDQGLVL